MKYIAFDIDGTIFDCSDIIVEAFQNGIMLFNKYSPKKIDIPSIERIISVLGQPTELIFQILFPELTEQEYQKINDLCTKSLTETISKGGGRLFNDVHASLERLQMDGYVLLIASNGRIEYIEAILNANNLMNFFSMPIIVIDNIIKNKTDIIRRYIRDISRNSLFIMIGDRSSDRIAADENNIHFIGCDFGHAEKSELHGSKWIAHEFSEIYELIKQIEEIHDFNIP